ncbi:phosphoglycerate dehydrogenase [Romboutsia ilealis]|uniref:phosphoglycerate dehydrogenase n=1 Tax=Romboutsia ilealis TaxID=1115758 RepID=UPI002573FAF3|nr:phosphoglycerate dehydrogenase [Romboutsia ilealis]
MKVLFTKDYGKEKFDKIKELGYEIIYCNENIVTNNEDVDSTDILVTYNPFKTLDINKMDNLKYIQTTSIGIDQIPVDKILNRDIVIANNKGGYSIPIGEWIVMSILEIYKNSKKFHGQQINKKWKMNFSITELSGKKIGFIGTGTLATEAAKRLQGFDVEVWGVNTTGNNKEYFDKCFKSDEMDEVFKTCDVVVVTIPATKETLGIINKDKFEIMKNGSVFINVGRGNIINEEDLIRYIHKFRGVALDVFEHEPLDKNSKLWEFDNVIITPHNSWVSDNNEERTFNMVYSNLKKYIENKPLNNLIDISKGY